ncbi:MAG: hypothetical protein KDI74_05565 [Gammaproteobacteria bacterium]|nr:hypothetical protein [Gammaproteobacteria bacterium]
MRADPQQAFHADEHLNGIWRLVVVRCDGGIRRPDRSRGALRIGQAETHRTYAARFN